MAAIHVSNILGAVLDAAALVATVRGGPCGARARVALDGVAFAPHLPVDVAAWGVDWCGSARPLHASVHRQDRPANNFLAYAVAMPVGGSASRVTASSNCTHASSCKHVARSRKQCLMWCTPLQRCCFLATMCTAWQVCSLAVQGLRAAPGSAVRHARGVRGGVGGRAQPLLRPSERRPIQVGAGRPQPRGLRGRGRAAAVPGGHCRFDRLSLPMHIRSSPNGNKL